jgi:hypothetical protein
MPVRLAIVLAIASAIVGTLVAQQTPMRDVPGYAASGTGVVGGVVVADDASRPPVRRAIVTLVRAGIEDMRAISTDEAGRFSFTDLPSGTYTLTAAKGGFITMSAGAAKPGMPGRQITVKDGGNVLIAPIALVRGAAIAGRITDVMGQPLSNVPVQASRFVTVGGERRPRTGSGSSFSTATNEHGEYRVFGLPAGEYVVSAWLNGFASQTDVTAQEIEFVRRVAAGGAIAVPPAPPRPYVLAPTLYPGTVNEASATAVVVAAGGERLGVDIALQRVPVARVSGVVTDIDGKPVAGVQVVRTLRAMPVFLPAIGTGARTASDGSFVLTNVSPGDHVVRATISSSVRSASLEGVGLAAPGTGTAVSQARWGLTEVAVNGADIAGVAIRMQPGMTVSGQLLVKGTAPPPDLSQVRISLAPGSSGAVPGYFPSAPVDGQGRFRIEGAIPGRYRVSVGSRAPYGVLSAMLGGQDVIDAPFEIAPNGSIEGITVTLTDARTELGGRLTGADGQPASHLYVLAFPQDRAHWAANSRRIASVRAGEDGSYTFTGLPPGNYFLCALTEIDTTLQYEPAYLDDLVPVSIKLSLGDGEKKIQHLRAGG